MRSLITSILCLTSLTYPNIALAQTSSPANSTASGFSFNQPGLLAKAKQFTSHYALFNGVR